MASEPITDEMIEAAWEVIFSRMALDRKLLAKALTAALAVQVEHPDSARLRAVVRAYQEAFPLRTADCHPEDCHCLRCEIDNASSALGGTNGK